MNKARRFILLMFFTWIFFFFCLMLLRINNFENKSRDLGPNLRSESHPQIIFYNRIPKTGSTTFTNAIAYDLCTANGFHVAHLNLTRNRYQMNRIDQARLAQNITEWRQMHPLFIHGHVAYLDFASLGHPSLVWINLIREPFARFVSHYYFLRFGDNFRVGLRRSKAGNNESFDECFRRGARECDPSSIWLQVSYFCGTAHFCAEPGSPQALELAKRNLVEKYLLVGLTERMEEMVQLLEQLVPSMFRGAAEHFQALDESRKHLRHTTRKFPPSPEVERQFKEHPIYKMEKKFYEFARVEFDANWKRVMGENGQFLSNQFHFEKIRP